MENYTIVAIISAIAFILYWLFLKPLVDYSLWINWWNKYGGDQYDCIDITALSYYNSNYLVYTLYNFIQKGSGRFQTDAQVQFVSNLINSYAYGIATVEQGKGLMPSHLCDKLVRKQRLNGQSYPTSTDGWHDLISGWAANTGATWNTDPDNFLWEDWSIPFNSPIVQAYIHNLSGPGMYPEALKYLISTDQRSGGFVGMMRYISSVTTSAGDFDNILWTIAPSWYKNDGTPNTSALKPGDKCTTASVAGSVFQSATTGVFIGSIMGGPLGLGVGILAAMAGSAIGAAQQGCF